MYRGKRGQVVHYFRPETIGELRSFSNRKRRVDRDICFGVKAMPEPSSAHMGDLADSVNVFAGVVHCSDEIRLHADDSQDHCGDRKSDYRIRNGIAQFVAPAPAATARLARPSIRA